MVAMNLKSIFMIQFLRIRTGVMKPCILKLTTFRLAKGHHCDQFFSCMSFEYALLYLTEGLYPREG
jgi:hypothetical protein